MSQTRHAHSPISSCNRVSDCQWLVTKTIVVLANQGSIPAMKPVYCLVIKILIRRPAVKIENFIHIILRILLVWTVQCSGHITISWSLRSKLSLLSLLINPTTVRGNLEHQSNRIAGFQLIKITTWKINRTRFPQFVTKLVLARVKTNALKRTKSEYSLKC